MSDSEFFLVKADVLPEVFNKVMAVKRLLSSGKAESVHVACSRVGLSRSAYYKYKDAVLPFYETSRGRMVTLVFAVENFPGILSGIITVLAREQANVLTINQNIPINGLADVSISIETDQMTGTLEHLRDELGKIPGVRAYQILARD
jgi:chorismate mutase